MDRFARLLTISCSLLLLASGAPLEAQRKLRIVATTEDLAALAREIGGDKVEVKAIARGYQDPHFVESKPSYILEASKADALLFVGLDLEIGWLPNILTGARNAKIQRGAPGHIDVSRGIRLQEVPTGRISREMGDIHAYGNPHYWLDPANARVMAENILNGLKAVDPENAAYYTARRQDFVARLDRKIKEWQGRMQPYKGLRVVAYHNTWPYFARAFGLVVDEFLEPKPGIPPSPSHIAAVITAMKRGGVKLILMEPYFSRKVPDLVATKSGGVVVELSPSVGGRKGISTYFDLFDQNLTRLIDAAQKAGVKPAGTARVGRSRSEIAVAGFRRAAAKPRTGHTSQRA